MSDPQAIDTQNRLFFIIMSLAMLLAVGKAVVLGLHPMQLLAISDNDDIMRLLSVRAWLEGQPWYDMTQYRMVPPEGLDLHWSRYVDLSIASIIWPLSQFLPMPVAEGIAVVAWPTLLLLGLIMLTGFAGRRLFGSMVGLGAMLGALLWTPAGPNNFGAGRLDHHNVQILLTTAIVMTLLLPGRPLRNGVLGGLAAALSLAVGLEMLLTIAVAGLVLVGRTVLMHPGAGRHLLGFSLALAVAGPVLFAGQVPPAEWAVTRCDELSAPYLALAAMGAALSLSIVVLTPRLPNLAVRAAVAVAICAAGLWLLFPLIHPCISGPYGSLPDEVRALISDRIVEARPAIPALMDGDLVAFAFVFPTAVTVILASAMWLAGRVRGTADPAVSRNLAILLIFGWLGLIASLSQVRLVIMGAAAVPLLIGVVLGPLMDNQNPSPIRRLLLIPLMAAILFSPPLFKLVENRLAGTAVATGASGAGTVLTESCRKPALLATLADLPKGVILSSSNFGAPLLLTTPHDVLTGPYHRSVAAMADGALPFDGDEAAMRAALARLAPDYLLLCRNAVYGHPESFATALAAGQPAAGLTPVPGPDPALLLLRVTGG